MRVCVSPGGATIYQGNQPIDELLVGTLDGVDVLRRGGDGTWKRVGRGLEGHHVSALLIEDSTGTIFAGTHGEGLFASEDGGQTWESRNTGLDQYNVYSLGQVAAPGGTRLYLGTEPVHLFTSEDLGRTWSELVSLQDQPSRERWMFPAPPHVAHLKNITSDPHNPDTLFAGVEVGGLYKSTDRGKTWTEIEGVYPDVHRTVIRPSDPDRFYITGGNGIYQTLDGGQNWDHLTTRTARFGYPDALIIHPQNHDLMFTAGAFASPRSWPEAHTADPCFARSEDGGKTWEVLTEGLPEHIHGNIEAMSMQVHPGGFGLFAATTDGEVFGSEDDGKHWAKLASDLAPISKGGHYRFESVPSRAEAVASARN